MTDLDRLLQRTAALHGHLCPRQVLGVRMGLHTGALLELTLPQRDKRLFTFVETDGCFVDEVGVATGCWLGRRTMRLLDYGKVAATFADTVTQRVPASELFDAQPIALSVSLAAIISQAGVRVMCARCGEEVINERHVERDAEMLCRACATSAYYHVSYRARKR